MPSTMNAATVTPEQIEPKPLVTFALIAYNQENYIREAVEGAFAQTYSPLEIILSDDCSTDRTFAIMQEMAAAYSGPHSIRLRRPERNLGLAAGVSQVSEMANGKLVVVAAGDDMSRPERTSKLVAAWIGNGCRSGSLYSRFSVKQASGNVEANPRVDGFTRSLSDRNIDMLNDFSGLSGCAQAWTRDIFELFGPIDNRIIHEDVIIPLRALLIGTITYVPDDLLIYRITPGSITRRTFRTGSERIEKMARYWAGRVAIFDQFHHDCEKILKTVEVNPADLEWLSSKVSMAEVHARNIFHLYSTNARRRLASVLSPSFRLSMGQRLKWVVISLFPWIYGKYRSA